MRAFHVPADARDHKVLTQKKKRWVVLLAIFIFGFLLVGRLHTASGAVQVLLGDQTIEASKDSDSAGVAESFKTTASSSGTLDTLKVYVDGSSAAHSLIAGVYSDNNNHPGSLLTQGSLSSPVSSSWNSVSVGQAPITSGTTYWVTVLGTGGLLRFRDKSGTGRSETSLQTTLTSLPSTWSTGHIYSDGPLSAYGTAVLAPDTTPPTTPTNLAVGSITASSISLTWSASTDNVGVTGYNIYLNGSRQASTVATSYNLSGLTCGTSYYLAVAAYDAAGNLSPQATASAITAACPDSTPPTTPANLVVSGYTDNSISLSWSVSTDNVGVVGYGIYNGGSTPVASTSGTTYTLTGLNCGMMYNLGVDAYDAAGNRSAVAFVTGQTDSCPPDSSPPSAPSNLSTTGASASSLTLSWTASTDNVAVQGYGLYLNGSLVASTSQTQYSYTGLSCATTYSLGVDAYDAAGNRSAVSSVSASTAACPDTTPPTVSLTAPADWATVVSTVTVSADAADNVAVASVQFKLDGANLGAAVTSSPYSIVWDTTTTTNGSHRLSAIATDTSGNSTTSAAITVTVNNPVPSNPVPMPAANTDGVLVGPGFVRSTSRQIIRTSNNTVYIFAVDDNVCQGTNGSAVLRAYKGSGAQAANAYVPTGFSEVDALHHPTSAGSTDCTFSASSMLEDPDVRLDPSGVVQMVYADGYNGNVYYQTFSTLTDTWGSRTLVAAGASTASGSGWPRTSQVALTLDANNQPWIVYASSGSSNSIMFTTMQNGSWTTASAIYSGSNEMHPSLVTSLDGSLHLAWLDNSLATYSVIKYAHYINGAWAPVETVSAGESTVLANGDDDQGPSIATDSQNRPHVLYMDGTVNGSNDNVRIRYRTASGTWTDNTPPGGSGGTSNPSGTLFAHTPGLYISGSDGEYAFLGHDVNIQYGYQYQLGGAGTSWGPYTTLDPQSITNPIAGDTCEPGTDGAASLRFDPLRDNNTGIIDSAYYDERDDSDCNHHHAQIFYKAVVIGENSNSNPPSNPDTTPPTVSISTPATGSTVSGSSVSLTSSASDNVGVSGVQFSVDGVNVGPLLSSAPYSYSWDSTTVANGSHTISSTAWDAAGNSSTTSVNVTVSNSSQPPPTSSLLSQGKPATASSTSTSAGPPAYVTDGSLTTRWSSSYADNQWLYIDLGTTHNITGVTLYWETAYGKSYQIQVSNDATAWTTIYSTTTGTGGTNTITGLSGSGRYVRMLGLTRGTQWGFSLWEFQVYGY